MSSLEVWPLINDLLFGALSHKVEDYFYTCWNSKFALGKSIKLDHLEVKFSFNIL